MLSYQRKQEIIQQLRLAKYTKTSVTMNLTHEDVLWLVEQLEIAAESVHS